MTTTTDSALSRRTRLAVAMTVMEVSLALAGVVSVILAYRWWDEPYLVLSTVMSAALVNVAARIGPSGGVAGPGYGEAVSMALVIPALAVCVRFLTPMQPGFDRVSHVFWTTILLLFLSFVAYCVGAARLVSLNEERIRSME